jgi:hypothetical protein
MWDAERLELRLVAPQPARSALAERRDNGQFPDELSVGTIEAGGWDGLRRPAE